MRVANKAFYDICSPIPKLAEAAGTDDLDSLSDAERNEAMRVQLTELKDLRDENGPMLEAFFASVADMSGGALRRVSSSHKVQQAGDFHVHKNYKTDDSIFGKVTRPTLLAEYPQYEMQHIRDALRFKCVVASILDAFRFLSLLVRQWDVVKLDLDKFLSPKEWGWRFLGCDVRM